MRKESFSAGQSQGRPPRRESLGRSASVMTARQDGLSPAEALRSWTSTPTIQSKKEIDLPTEGKAPKDINLEALKKSNSLPSRLDQVGDEDEDRGEKGTKSSFLQHTLDREANLALYGVSNVHSEDEPDEIEQDTTNSRARLSPKFSRYFSRSMMFSKSQVKLEMPMAMHQRRSMAMQQLKDVLSENILAEEDEEQLSASKKVPGKSMRRFQEKGRQLIATQRAAQMIKEKASAPEQKTPVRQSCFSKVLDPAATYVLTINALAAVACISDILMMFLEAASYTGSQPCTKAGGPFSEGCENVRGYLGPSVFAAKMTLGILADLIYLVDMYLHFRTARDVTWFQTSIDAKSVATDYLFGRFVWDLVASAPIYWIFCQSPWVRLNRVLRVLNFGKINRFVKLLVAMGVTLNVQVLRIARFLIFISCWMHVVACCTMIVVWQSLDVPGGEEMATRWLDLESAEDISDWKFLYLHCQYWAWTNLTGWGGEWSPQSASMIGWTYGNQIVGVFLYMYIFGEIVSILQNFDMAEAEFNAKRDMVHRFLNIRDVPKDVQVRVHNWFERMWDAKHGTEEDKVLEYLPPFLRHDLAYHLNKLFIEKVPMFIGADATALMEVNRYLVQTVATAGEYIIRSGEIGREMYFVISGSLELLNEDGSVQTQLYEGSVIGEIPLLHGIPSPHTIRAKSDCDLLKLSDKDFATIIDFFPALRRKLERRGAMVYGTKWQEWEAMAALGVGLPPDEANQQPNVPPTSEAQDTLQFDFFARRSSVVSTNSLPDQSFCARPRSCASDITQHGLKDLQSAISTLQGKQDLMMTVIVSLQRSQQEIAASHQEILNFIRPARTSSYNPRPKEEIEVESPPPRQESIYNLLKFQEPHKQTEGVQDGDRIPPEEVQMHIPAQPSSSGSTTANILQSGFDRPSSYSSSIGGRNPYALPDFTEPQDLPNVSAYLALPGAVDNVAASNMAKYSPYMASKVEESVDKCRGSAGSSPYTDSKDVVEDSRQDDSDPEELKSRHQS